MISRSLSSGDEQLVTSSAYSLHCCPPGRIRPEFKGDPVAVGPGVDNGVVQGVEVGQVDVQSRG